MQYPPGPPGNPYGPPPGPPGNPYGPPPGPPGNPYGPPPGPQGFGPPGYGPPPAPTGFAPPAMQMGAPYGIHPRLGIPYSDKSKVIAAILQLLVGFGVGRFYIGHTNIAIPQLIACLVGFVLAFFTCGISAIVCFWPFVDGIILLMSEDVRDANGYPLR